MYNINSIVFYNGTLYICILSNSNNLPINTTYWSVYQRSQTYGGYFNRLKVNGLYKNIRNVYYSGYIYNNDCVIHCYNSSSDITLTLPIPTKSMIGMELRIRILGTRTVTIVTQSSTYYPIWVSGTVSSFTITNNDGAILIWDGNYWVKTYLNEV